MKDSPLVCQEGRVVGFKNGKIQVKILASSACAKCHARGLCTSLEMQEKIIDALPSSDSPINIGDTVQVIMEEKLGLKAVFYGFLLPLILLLGVLFISYNLGSGEIGSAFWAIGSMIPYYLLLYVFRRKIEKDFIFKIEVPND